MTAEIKRVRILSRQKFPAIIMVGTIVAIKNECIIHIHDGAFPYIYSITQVYHFLRTPESEFQIRFLTLTTTCLEILYFYRVHIIF